MHAATLLSQQPSTTEQALGWGLGTIVLVAALGAVVLFVAALVSIIRSPNYTVAGRAVWIFVVLAFPFLGPLVWFVWGRKSTFAVDAANGLR
ncbi:PLDc_N domain-containing protein [Rhodococcus sp. SBT000017]|uniref:PLD nuclease N-terminal domain-containing protein n=1 Tax=unclassified Rhodococcus (in: high G+C Gram-positive bacteria) TaxID=192944 RepID=UPI000B0DD3EF|nr:MULTISPECIES: PLD nuclease N-terminal domain-containing protein [unclassified Rhodococcus (in: high G+C Gram-positive bacteria)]RMB77776.1 PLDc_N domain-containing protein [Rhodococcus sp. SBT000017]